MNLILILPPTITAAKETCHAIHSDGEDSPITVEIINVCSKEIEGVDKPFSIQLICKDHSVEEYKITASGKSKFKIVKRISKGTYKFESDRFETCVLVPYLEGEQWKRI